MDEILLNPQMPTHSETVPGTSRNADVENQDPNGDLSQNDPHPEVGPSVYQSHHSIDSDSNEAPHSIQPEKAASMAHIQHIGYFHHLHNSKSTA